MGNLRCSEFYICPYHRRSLDSSRADKTACKGQVQRARRKMPQGVECDAHCLAFKSAYLHIRQVMSFACRFYAGRQIHLHEHSSGPTTGRLVCNPNFSLPLFGIRFGQLAKTLPHGCFVEPKFPLFKLLSRVDQVCASTTRSGTFAPTGNGRISKAIATRNTELEKHVE